MGLGAVVGVCPATAATLAPQRVSDPSFTIAVIPDTQRETKTAGDPRISHRNRWLIDHREDLDLRFAAQVGDLTDWGWLVPAQLTRASSAFRLFEDAGVPYSIAVGNHDTRTVGIGGSAYVYGPDCLARFSPGMCRSPVLLRHTEEINDVFDTGRFGNVRGAFEAGKIDNVYSTFRAEGYSWLVLDLEIWPRQEVVAWANRVVKDHPDANVVVNTHAYLTGKGAIDSNAHNGVTSARELWEQLISRHENIWLVTCGHAGRAATRVDRGVNGNKVVTLLTTMHKTATNTNPVRLVQLDPRAGVMRTRLVGPMNDQQFPHHSATVEGLHFVR